MAYSPKIIAASDRINVQLVSNFHQSTTTADNLDGNDHGFSDDVSMSYVQENSENEHRGNFPKDMYKNQELLTWLYSWKLKHNISHDAMSELLNQLRICGHADLPKDARTLLGTPTFNPVEISATGDDDNIQLRNLDKSEQVVADKSEQVVANKSEQVVADKSEQVMADKSKQMITDKSEQVVADKSEQMVADKSEQMMTDKSEQMVVDNCSYDEDAQSSAWTDKIRLREHLISEIRKRPPLWNFKLPPEKRRIEKRERLWEEVSIKLNKEGSTKKLKKMWRSLCDSFRVHHYRKKMLPSKSTICSPWVHYESMKFISDVQLQSFTITNAADTKTLTTDRTVNDDNNSTDRCAKNRTTKNRRQRCTKRDYT